MSNDRNLRWQKILWSVVIIFAISLFLYLRYNQTYHVIKFSIFPYFIWPYLAALSSIVIVLRIIRLGISRESFIYILIGTTNFYIGGIGSYILATSDAPLSWGIHAMFYSSLLAAIIVLSDTFGRSFK